MERIPDIKSNENGCAEPDNALDRGTELNDIMEAAYKHPDLMSILSENLMYCSDIGAALYAVVTENEKALLETFRQ